jgi:hypothetical protein
MSVPEHRYPFQMTGPEAIAFRHEHGRLYDALEHAAQLAELAGHDILAASLRRDRHDVAEEFTTEVCRGR